ncbi:MAG: protein kinase, partial [Deltaproteobacteria bacterium]|nr:protein kinase [Deltaproteobacteria bacterium]
YVIQDKEEREYVLRLYRQGKEPKPEVFNRLVELSKISKGLFCQTYETGFDSATQRYYEIQEFFPHGDLGSFLRQNTFTSEDFLALARQLGEALKTLHTNEMVHRDIKPDNILLRSAKPLSLALTDFGISSLLAPGLSLKETRMANTPLYSAPESFSDFAGIPGDYWSLGVVLLEAILGKHPLEGLSVNAVMREITTRGIMIPKTLTPRVGLILRGLLTRDDKKRWGQNELQKWLAGEDSIPLYYEEPQALAASFPTGSFPYKFRGKEHLTPQTLALEFSQNPECWKQAREHLSRGYIRNWLEKRGHPEEVALLERISEGTPDENLYAFIQNFQEHSLPFWRCLVLTFKNIEGLFKKDILTPEEQLVQKEILEGKLANLVSISKNAGNLLEPSVAALLSFGKEISREILLDAIKVTKFPKNYVWGPAGPPKNLPQTLTFALEAQVPLLSWERFFRNLPEEPLIPKDVFYNFQDPENYSMARENFASLETAGTFNQDLFAIFPVYKPIRVNGRTILISPNSTEEFLDSSHFYGGLDGSLNYLGIGLSQDFSYAVRFFLNPFWGRFFIKTNLLPFILAIILTIWLVFFSNFWGIPPKIVPNLAGVISLLVSLAAIFYSSYLWNLVSHYLIPSGSSFYYIFWVGVVFFLMFCLIQIPQPIYFIKCFSMYLINLSFINHLRHLTYMRLSVLKLGN